jgi:hypothetical protein
MIGEIFRLIIEYRTNQQAWSQENRHGYILARKVSHMKKGVCIFFLCIFFLFVVITGCTATNQNLKMGQEVVIENSTGKLSVTLNAVTPYDPARSSLQVKYINSSIPFKDYIARMTIRNLGKEEVQGSFEAWFIDTNGTKVVGFRPTYPINYIGLNPGRGEPNFEVLLNVNLSGKPDPLPNGGTFHFVWNETEVSWIVPPVV